jgi:hypothetical protein
MMHDGNVVVVPSYGDGVAVRFGDLATVAGITAPTNAASLLELSRIVGSHYFGFPLSRSWAAAAFRFARSAATSAKKEKFAETKKERSDKKAGLGDDLLHE